MITEDERDDDKLDRFTWKFNKPRYNGTIAVKRYVVIVHRACGAIDAKLSS